MPTKVRERPPQLQAVRDEVERKVEAAVDEILRNDWKPQAEAEAAGTYGEILRDVSQTSVLDNPSLMAEYLELMAPPDPGVKTPRNDNLAIANRVNAARKAIESESIPALARAISGTPSGPRTARKETAMGRVGATVWTIISRTVGTAGALLLVAAAVALVVPGNVPEMGFVARILSVIFLILGAALLVLTFFFPDWQSRLFERASERALRRDLAARHEQTDETPR